MNGKWPPVNRRSDQHQPLSYATTQVSESLLLSTTLRFKLQPYPQVFSYLGICRDVTAIPTQQPCMLLASVVRGTQQGCFGC
jgi:hypothetical protein